MVQTQIWVGTPVFILVEKHASYSCVSVIRKQ